MKTYLIAFILFTGILNLKAQNYELNVRAGDQISINNLLGEIKVEGYKGSKLIIETNYQTPEVPERAKGLKPIYGAYEDNTKIGLNIQKNGNTVQILGLAKGTQKAHFLFKIPQGVNLKIDSRSPFAEKDITVTDFSSEIEVRTLNSDIKLNNVTGPIVLNTIDGEVDINFSKVNQEAPISISSIDGNVDITMPSDTPANLVLGTMDGELYSNFDIDFGKDKKKENLPYVGGGQKLTGTINGGGVKIAVKTIDKNIYLRKK